MERLAVILMILAGSALAGIVGGLLSRAASRDSRKGSKIAAATDLDHVAGSIVFSVARLGGGRSDAEIASVVIKETGFGGPFDSIDPGAWASSFRRRADRESCRNLLENAVKTSVAVTQVIPLIQYNALLDLSFVLGFQTDALARLRARYRFNHIDYARDRRPRDAEESGRQVFYRRNPDEIKSFLTELGLTELGERSELISAYRLLAGEVHPDRFHDASEEERSAAADRFIRLTEAYEGLLAEMTRGD